MTHTTIWFWFLVAIWIRGEEWRVYYVQRGFSGDRAGNYNIRRAQDAAQARGYARTLLMDLSAN